MLRGATRGRRVVAKAKTLLTYFAGPSSSGPAADQTSLRTVIPERARRAYPVAPVIATLADEGSVTFLRERFAPAAAQVRRHLVIGTL